MMMRVRGQERRQCGATFDPAESGLAAVRVSLCSALPTLSVSEICHCESRVCACVIVMRGILLRLLKQTSVLCKPTAGLFLMRSSHSP